MNQQKIAAMEQEIKKKHKNIAGIVIMKDGAAQYENYYHECNAASQIHVYSVTKSIISILIGIALDKGFLDHVDQKVLDFFPDYSLRKGGTAIEHISLKNLLTMTAPYRYLFAPYIKYFTSKDMVKFTLDQLGGRGRIGEFRYTPLIGPDILSGILIKATGQSVLDFARENLFSPLEITVTDNIIFHSKEEQLSFNHAINFSGWVADSKGVNTGGWGLTLSPTDMAKIGQLYLNGGIWCDRRIVSSNWIAESTREHSRWKKLNFPYGYLWWVRDKEAPGYAAMGDGGNVIYVNTRKKLVVAITALFDPKAADRLDFIDTFIEPAFK